MKEITLWATIIGAPDWQEELITSTTDPEHLRKAKQWALDNGFDRLREKEFTGEMPDFTKTLNI